MVPCTVEQSKWIDSIKHGVVLYPCWHYVALRTKYCHSDRREFAVKTAFSYYLS